MKPYGRKPRGNDYVSGPRGTEKSMVVVKKATERRLNKSYTTEPPNDDATRVCVLCGDAPRFRVHLCRECHAERNGQVGLYDFEWGITALREKVATALRRRAETAANMAATLVLENCATAIEDGKLP